ncbi:cell adhesion molecule Dscam2 [Cylas formicarius]|uniref:cell adhesion molecule Dscam2 n=1 Tax=Cylas formicarius TaxID=197179 RepID=UPI0029586858|nr:cell adhesion molecule Dscam2 [Cylas formicarius]
MRAILFFFIIGVESHTHGPVYLLEPPPRLTFSNTTGSQVSCSAHGSPNPQVEWLLHDGKRVTAVPGLRQSLGNGTLYFPPFRAEDYRADVHSTMYRCRASNIVGTILSREVHVQAVVNEHYEVNVYHSHVIAGNTAVLKCVIPSVVKEHVTVTSWSRDESILLPGPNMGGRIVVTYGSGDLLIRSARADDSLPTYSCLTIHSLTQERKRSVTAKLSVIESTRSVAPRLTPTVLTALTTYRETDIHLTCTAQGNPPPNFGWFRDTNGHLQPVQSSSRFEPSQDIMLIKRLKPEDSGRWTCKVHNSFGEQRLDIHLTVVAHLSVHVLPQLQVINSGDTAIFNCTVSGSPVGRVQWLKNSEMIHPDENGKVKLLSPLVLQVSEVTRHDKGMYQCVVQNEKENAQGSAELRLGDTIPELQYNFIDQALQPGPHVSLRCSATGSPPPQFRWLLDGQPLSGITHDNRYAISQYLDYVGDVVSHLNITNVRVEDGGLYSCVASNSLGSVEHSARINVYGPPFIRSVGPAKAVAGTDAVLHCPYAGYPIKSVRWERHGQELPQDMRHHLDEGGALTILRVDQNTDKGFYTCYVTSREGHVARKEIRLIVNAPPVMEPFAFPASMQEGGRAQVTCTVTSGDLPIHFFWYKDGEPISAALEVEERAAEFYSMLVFKEVYSRHSGAYTCVASNAAARVNYTAQLMVKVAPQWIIEPQNVSALLGNSILIQCLAKGFPEPTISWLKGQGKGPTDYRPINLHRVNPMANGSLWFDSVVSQAEGHYLCRATNGIGSGLGKVIYVAVNEPARFEVPNKNVSVKRGAEVTLLCHVHGDVPIEVIWIFNSKPLDLHKIRYSHVSSKDEKEVKSQVTIARTDREDSGVYKCLAENDFGRSEHTINLAVQEKPDPPSHLEAVEVSSRSVKLSWRRSFDGNSPIIGYIAQYKILDSIRPNWDQSNVLNLTLPSGTTSGSTENAIIGALQPATVYTIRMLAVNGIDHSDFTESIAVKTQEERPSEAPKDIRVEAISSTDLFIQWSPPPRHGWNGELLGYSISWREHRGSKNQTGTQTIKGWATNKFQLSGLKKYTTYDITVSAFNGVDAGPASPTIIGTTKEGIPEAPPQDIICSEVSSQIIKISWKVPPHHLHGGLIQGYKIFYRPVSGLLSEDVASTTGEVKRTQSTETYLHGLQKFTNYSIRVLAYTSAGDGIVSDTLYCCTEEDLPGAPANIKAAALTGESILVSWLPPTKRNGHIIVYTVYCREAGRVGQHKSYNIRLEDIPEEHSLNYEVRILQEHQLYEFWVSATTKIGEGEATSIVAQATNSRAPSRIVSFSQILHQPNKSRVLLPCLAVGNPKPRTRWIHQNKPITFSTFFAVTLKGDLNIHNVDISLSGNYTCSAINLFGEDEITYMLVVLMPPNAPQVEVQFVTSNSIRLKWTQPENGGAIIQGYILNIKDESQDWSSMELSPEYLQYTVENLRCGSLYHIYLMAQNKVGRGSPSKIISVSTKGGSPQLPKEDKIITTNYSVITLNLKNWPNGGCPISQFSVQYKPYSSSEWLLIANSVSEEEITIQNLVPATWYQVKISAQNDAGLIYGLFNTATATVDGSRVPKPPKLHDENVTSDNSMLFRESFFLIPASILASLIIFLLIFWFAIYKRKRQHDENQINRNEEVAEDAQNTHRHHRRHPRQREEKLAERQNNSNTQQVYTSSPVKAGEKVTEEISGTYEITPYATFVVPASNNSDSIDNLTLDYTLQFKTFGHIEDGEHSNIILSKNASNKSAWHKNHFYHNDASLHPQTTQFLYRPQTQNRGDSESEDTSGSGRCSNISPNSASTSYRTERQPRKIGYTGYETLLVTDLYRRDSSTESNEVSPLAERKQTPRHVAGRRHYRTASSSSSEEDTPQNMKIQPPIRFSDSKELSEAECDRDLKLAELFNSELADIVVRYQQRKEQERKEFTIHV